MSLFPRPAASDVVDRRTRHTKLLCKQRGDTACSPGGASYRRGFIPTPNLSNLFGGKANIDVTKKEMVWTNAGRYVAVMKNVPTWRNGCAMQLPTKAMCGDGCPSNVKSTVSAVIGSAFPEPASFILLNAPPKPGHCWFGTHKRKDTN